MEILLILLLPILLVWSEYLMKRGEEEEEILRAKKEMWRQERIDQLWEKELKIRANLYEDIFGEEHEYSRDLRMKAWKKGLTILLSVVLWILLILFIIVP